MISRSNGCADPADGESGFTLMEMLVVIAVMALTMLLIANYMQPHSHWLQTQAAGRQVAEAMRDAHGQAITQGEPVALVLPHLPPWLHAVEAPPNGVLFNPDGSSSGGSVLLGSAGERSLTVTADWLTGRVQINAN